MTDRGAETRNGALLTDQIRIKFRWPVIIEMRGIESHPRVKCGPRPIERQCRTVEIGARTSSANSSRVINDGLVGVGECRVFIAPLDKQIDRTSRTLLNRGSRRKRSTEKPTTAPRESRIGATRSVTAVTGRTVGYSTAVTYSRSGLSAVRSAA